MREKELRDYVRQRLGYEGWVVWFAPRVKFLKQQDIFSIWDAVAARQELIKFIQFTTKENKSSHLKKIQDYKELYQLYHKGELWLYDKKKKDFEIVEV